MSFITMQTWSTGRVTVPSFVDYKEKKVVNNDYHRLTNYLRLILSHSKSRMHRIFILRTQRRDRQVKLVAV